MCAGAWDRRPKARVRSVGPNIIDDPPENDFGLLAAICPALR